MFPMDWPKFVMTIALACWLPAYCHPATSCSPLGLQQSMACAQQRTMKNDCHGFCFPNNYFPLQLMTAKEQLLSMYYLAKNKQNCAYYLQIRYKFSMLFALKKEYLTTPKLLDLTAPPRLVVVVVRASEEIPYEVEFAKIPQISKVSFLASFNFLDSPKTFRWFVEFRRC